MTSTPPSAAQNAAVLHLVADSLLPCTRQWLGDTVVSTLRIPVAAPQAMTAAIGRRSERGISGP